MASLVISTNTPRLEAKEMDALMLKLSAEVAALTEIQEEDLLIQVDTGCSIVFRGSTAPAAHAFWSFGGYSKKLQNKSLRDAVSALLLEYMNVDADRVRITRVQLYEVLDKSNASDVLSGPVSPVSPRPPKADKRRPRRDKRRGKSALSDDEGAKYSALEGTTEDLPRPE